MAISFSFGHSPVKGENSYTLLGWLLLYIIRQDKPHPIVLHKSTMSNLKNSIQADATLMLAFINRCALEKNVSSAVSVARDDDFGTRSRIWHPQIHFPAIAFIRL